jgi:DNA-directed RNA polymerase subunit F
MKIPKKEVKERLLTVPQAKEMLEKIGEEKLDQFQRRTLDFTAKFSRMDSKTAEELMGKLVEQFELDSEEAAQIVNCMPESIEEIRVFLAGGRKIVETSKLEALLAFLNKYRKSE